MPEWISVKDRLPDKPGRYLTHCITIFGTACCVVLEYSSKRKRFNLYDSITEVSHDFDDVTHWMPLPEPPEETSV